jgi:hypothetical protein
MIRFAYVDLILNRAGTRRDKWGEGGRCIFIYSCPARRISFESDCFYGM